MSRTAGTPGQNVDCNLAFNGNRSQVFVSAFPKDWYSWTDRTVTTPDVGSTWATTSFSPTSTSDAGTLLVTAEGSTAGSLINLALIFWDERNLAIAVIPASIQLSSSVTNAAGNYVCAGTFTGSLVYSPVLIDVTCFAGYAVVVTGLGGSSTVIVHSRLF